MTRFQILKQIIVTKGQVIAECKVVLAYKVIVVNSQLATVDCRLDCSAEIRGGCIQLAPSPLSIRGPCNYSKILTFSFINTNDTINS